MPRHQGVDARHHICCRLLQHGPRALRLNRAEFTEMVESRWLELAKRVEDGRLGAIPVVQRLLCPPDRSLRARCELGRHFERPVVHHVVLDAHGHETDAFCFLARERVAGLAVQGHAVFAGALGRFQSRAR